MHSVGVPNLSWMRTPRHNRVQGPTQPYCMWVSHSHLRLRFIRPHSSTIKRHPVRRATTLHSPATVAASSMSTNNATSAPPLPQTDTGPSTAGNLRSLATSFLTFTASGDWAKIFVFGWLLETCRRYLFHWRDAITNRFWITATFDANDYSHGKLIQTLLPQSHADSFGRHSV